MEPTTIPEFVISHFHQMHERCMSLNIIFSIEEKQTNNMEIESEHSKCQYLPIISYILMGRRKLL